MNFQNKLINLLTICRKSGNLTLGFDMVKETIKNKKSKNNIIIKWLFSKNNKRNKICYWYWKYRNSFIKRNYGWIKDIFR